MGRDDDRTVPSSVVETLLSRSLALLPVSAERAVFRRTWRSTPPPPPPPCAPQVELLDVAFPYVIAPSDWADPVVVRVVALDDALDERYRHNDAIRVTVVSLDPDYGGDDNTTLNVTILDDDASGGALAADATQTWVESSSGDGDDDATDDGSAASSLVLTIYEAAE